MFIVTIFKIVLECYADNTLSIFNAAEPEEHDNVIIQKFGHLLYKLTKWCHNGGAHGEALWGENLSLSPNPIPMQPTRSILSPSTTLIYSSSV